MMPKTYRMSIAGLERDLILCKLNDEITIAAFVMFSDVELTVACAAELLKRAPAFDVILTAEAKGIPLAYEMAKQSGKNYVLARKMSKLYMFEPIEFEVQSITTARKQKLFLDSHELRYLTDKRVLIADDVISTGGSMYALERLCDLAKCQIAGKCAVLAEGVAQQRDDIFYLEKLPIFNTADVFAT